MMTETLYRTSIATMLICAAMSAPSEAQIKKRQPAVNAPTQAEGSRKASPRATPLTVQECLRLGGKVEWHDGCATNVKCSNGARAACIDEGLAK